MYAEEYWQQYVHYNMDVQLDVVEKTVGGTSKIEYTNNSPDALDHIHLHLYPNAFQKGSVKYREFRQNYGRRPRAEKFIKGFEDSFSRVDVHRFKITSNGTVLADTFKVEDTILSAQLSQDLRPGQSLAIELDWTHYIGEQVGRAGRVDDQYNMAQWYPKLVVYDEHGWHNLPFHATGEFYGEFGTFDVSIDLPSWYVIGATGVVTYGDPGWEAVRVDTSRDFEEWLEEFQENKTEVDSTQRRKVSFHAKQVHDFAWIASPTFLYESGSWNDIDVHVLFNEDNGESWTKEVVARSERALEWLSRKFGMYPYPQVTTTDRIRGGGMEYPMLVMNGSASEGLILHEVGHIWFYGILGNNEVTEAWLDEGFTTFQTRWYLMDRYGEHGFDLKNTKRYKPFQKKYWHFTNTLGNSQWSVINFQLSGADEPISKKSYLFKGNSSYRYNAYSKPGVMLDELQYVLGDSIFDAGMQEYYKRWELKHPNEARFKAAMEETSGEELDWFFDPWLHDTQILDYGIKDWKSSQKSDGNWTVDVDLVKYGNREMPQLLEVKLADGSKERIWWKNHQWRKQDTFSFQLSKKPVAIVLDPDVKTVDVDRRNNHSNGLPRKWMFRWPGMNWNHRDSYLQQWSPALNYHELDGYMPGLWLSRSYGSWQRADLHINYGIKSEEIYWDLRSMRKPVHRSTGLRYNFHAFDQGGLSGVSWNMDKSWSRWNSRSPNHYSSLGFYSTNARDTSRTNLFENGQVTVVYGKWTISNSGRSLDLELATAPPGSFSDWNFNRLTLVGKASKTIKGIELRSRFIYGHMNHDTRSSVPGQELYTINGAGAFDTFLRPYLRDESSFYGNTTLRQHYHLSGDVNLRGFFDTDLAGAQSLLGSTVEVIFNVPITFITLEAALFTDMAYFLPSDNLNEIKGQYLSDAGIGLRTQKNMFGKELYLRLDFPLVTNDSRSGRKQEFQWVFSFERSI